MKAIGVALCTLVIAASLASPALAIPGQTAAQCLAWGKANHAFSKFVRANSDEAGGVGYEFDGTATIAGNQLEFAAKPDKRGTIQMEQMSFVGDTGGVHLSDAKTVAQVIAAVYGPQYLADYQAAELIPNTRDVSIWRGKRLGYVTLGDVLFAVPLARVETMVNNARVCDALDCSAGP